MLDGGGINGEGIMYFNSLVSINSLFNFRGEESIGVYSGEKRAECGGFIWGVTAFNGWVEVIN